MSNGIYTALSGSIARQVQLDAVSHNLANVDTVGFKEQRALFQQNLVDAANGNHQVQVSGLATDFDGGSLEETESNLDLAIVGEGFFVLDQGEEVILTRNGSFDLSVEGYLINQEGFPVLDSAGEQIQLFGEPESLLIEPGGSIWDEEGMVAQLAVVNVQDPSMLQQIGEGMLTTARSNLIPVEEGEVVQGYLETSNVEMVRSMTEMITLHRYFDAMQKLISEHHSMDKKVIQSVGRVG